MLFEAYPIVFEQGHHFSPSASGLSMTPACLSNMQVSSLQVPWA